MLEVAVLLLAWLGLWTVGERDPSYMPGSTSWVENSDLLTALVRLLAPLGVLIGVYLLWAGANEPGGAFRPERYGRRWGCCCNSAGVCSLSRSLTYGCVAA
ncbi:MAG: MnhB domain-containing protein [Candidatus Competibacteraceae bacterium]